MRIALPFVVLALLLVVPAGVASGAKKPIKVTFVGDSIADSLSYVPTARAQLSRGYRVRLDLKVCRRLVQTSCSFQGSAPTTALEAVRGYGRALGDVLVVKVGYNESAYGYRKGIDQVMRAAVRQGAKGVVWVTLRETLDTYRQTNAAIKSAARRWRKLVVADWNAYSRGKPWFGSDGLHLTVAGANALAAFLRPFVLAASRS